MEFCGKSSSVVIVAGTLTVFAIGMGTLRAFGASSSGTATLVPMSYKTTYGKDNAQPVSKSIDILDETGKTNNWLQYLQFQSRTAQAKYAGSRDYYMTGDLASERFIDLTVKVNYLGPLPSLQVWTWYIHNWTTDNWDPIGTNAGCLGWDGWSILKFKVPGSPSSYIRTSDGLIEIGTTSNNTADDADIDYEAVIVNYSAKESK